MALPMKHQAAIWMVAAIVFLVVLWILGDVILPFVLGGAIAYIFDPLADRLERLGLKRSLAVLVITLVGICVFAVAMLLVVPTLVRQAIDLFEAAPEMVANLQAALTERFPDLMDDTSVVRQSLSSIGETIQSRGGELMQGLMTSLSGVVNVIVLLVIVPVVSVYLLLDWDRMVASIDSLLPRDGAPTIRQLARDIDHTMAGFIRGQGLVCLILGTFYAVSLMLVGLKFGLVAGALAGFLTFIPFVGAFVGGALSIGLALFQFWGDWWMIVLVYAIFQVGQFVEGNILTPKLVGTSVGLHPVWLLFALSAFGALFGFVGLLVAVPVAAALGVIARFLVDEYKEGPLYRGVSGETHMPAHHLERSYANDREAPPDDGPPVKTE
ncbi:AI-2E family transporter [Tropicimonas sp. IMCC34011]|uniref:AI-2E family transporter n=1 Tax=Tropicimonas sp. IMCC34011 TaxID=2248759 RepID=UPI000E279472|nr:AI-2E family transporter [Tropicimonas sp. IMCC34011]